MKDLIMKTSELTVETAQMRLADCIRIEENDNPGEARSIRFINPAGVEIAFGTDGKNEETGLLFVEGAGDKQELIKMFSEDDARILFKCGTRKVAQEIDIE